MYSLANKRDKGVIIKIRYNPKLKSKARELRKQGVLSEALLWNCLKARKMRGYQFMRQKPIDNFIVDFFCGKLRLIIEIDGSTHKGKSEYDKFRQGILEGIGLTLLRFSDLDIKTNMAGVIKGIENYIDGYESAGKG